MAITTHSAFNHRTEGHEVAVSFSSQIYGKTIIITGVNLEGIGFATAQALVSSPQCLCLRFIDHT
jgi:hypothetical protein